MPRIKYQRGFKGFITGGIGDDGAETSEYVCYIGIMPHADVVTEYGTLAYDGWLSVKKGFPTDFASGPSLDRDWNIRGACEHDFGYWLMREGHLSKEFKSLWDARFRKVLREDISYLRSEGRISRFEAFIRRRQADNWFIAVTLRGHKSLEPDTARGEKVAP